MAEDSKSKPPHWLLIGAILVLVIYGIYTAVKAKKSIYSPSLSQKIIEEEPSFLDLVRSYVKPKKRDPNFLGCELPVKDGHTYASVQEGTMTLKFPKGERMNSIQRKNDMKDGCMPHELSVRLYWSHGQLLNSKEYPAETTLANAQPVEDPNFGVVKLMFYELDVPADVYKEKLYEKKLFGEGLFFEAAHYAPSFEHRLLPLNYHPSLFRNDVLSLETIKSNLPYSIQGSRSSLTGFPIRVSCDVVTLKDASGKSSLVSRPPAASGKISLEEALTTRMVKVSEWVYSRCQGVDVVEKNGQYLQFVFEVGPDAVVDLDQVHQAILARVESYIQDK